MKRKFIQAVSMPCTKEQYEKRLQSKLCFIGYQFMADADDSMKSLFANTITNGQCRWYDVADFKPKNAFHIDHYNPDLFLAIAAMSGGGYWEGEWVVYRGDLYKMVELQDGPRGTKSIVVIENSKGNNVIALERLHKATLQELVAHFTTEKPVDEALPSGVPTEEEVRQMYTEKYGHLPDLLERILSQLDYRFFFAENTRLPTLKLSYVFNDWHKTSEGALFWSDVLNLETAGSLNRHHLDVAYERHQLINQSAWQPKNGEMIEVSEDGEAFLCRRFIGMDGGRFVVVSYRGVPYENWKYAKPYIKTEVPLSDLIAAWAEKNGKNPELVKLKASNPTHQ